MKLHLEQVERPRPINLYLKPSIIDELDEITAELDVLYPGNKSQHSRGDAVEALVNAWVMAK